MRLPTALLLAAIASTALARPPAFGVVDLDRPGALAEVRRENPEHYQAIKRILAEAPTRRPETVAGWVRTAFDAEMSSVMRIKTSYPPKARLSFQLEHTRYEAVITLQNTEPYLTPAG